MAESSDIEARLNAPEARVEEVAADAAAARHLAAAGDRDLADLGVKVDANRAVINALGVQTAARFDEVDRRFDRLENEMRAGFAEIRGRLDGAAAGQQQIVDLLTGLITRQDDS
jgi:hypothetical protein